MGRQINFYMTQEEYRKVLANALKAGLIVLYQEAIGGKPYAWEYKIHRFETIPNFDLTHCHYLYAPNLGDFYDPIGKCELTLDEIEQQNLALIPKYAPMIEAGCSYISHKEKRIVSNRLYVQSGWYGPNNEYVSQNEILLKLYEKLVRLVKKIAPRQEVTKQLQNPKNPVEFKSREYVSNGVLKLINEGYKLR